ncbi:uncharacterized protein LOC135939485 [Cloeon dipterum]|uniref:uncharacterized protein LOC135939485 n=1 Tax=Cloeon dipterum TaxID=197152 RepID=UPI00322052AB
MNEYLSTLMVSPKVVEALVFVDGSIFTLYLAAIHEIWRYKSPWSNSWFDRPANLLAFCAYSLSYSLKLALLCSMDDDEIRFGNGNCRSLALILCINPMFFFIYFCVCGSSNTMSSKWNSMEFVLRCLITPLIESSEFMNMLHSRRLHAGPWPDELLMAVRWIPLTTGTLLPIGGAVVLCLTDKQFEKLTQKFGSVKLLAALGLMTIVSIHFVLRICVLMYCPDLRDLPDISSMHYYILMDPAILVSCLMYIKEEAVIKPYEVAVRQEDSV